METHGQAEQSGAYSDQGPKCHRSTEGLLYYVQQVLLRITSKQVGLTAPCRDLSLVVHWGTTHKWAQCSNGRESTAFGTWAIIIAVGLQSTIFLPRLSKQRQQSVYACPTYIKYSFFIKFIFVSGPPFRLPCFKVGCCVSLSQLLMVVMHWKAMSHLCSYKCGTTLVVDHSNTSVIWAIFTLRESIRHISRAQYIYVSHITKWTYLAFKPHQLFSLANTQNTAAMESNAIKIIFTHFRFMWRLFFQSPF